MFYEKGVEHACAQLGLIKEARLGSLSGIWKGMAPEGQALLKQMGAGAAVGAAPGAMYGASDGGGLTGALGGALMGGAAGAVGGRALGRRMQQATRKGIGQEYRQGLQQALQRGGNARGYAQANKGYTQGLLGQTDAMAFPTMGRLAV